MRGFAAVGLWQPKTVANIGSALRSAHCYGASLVAVKGRRYTVAPTDTLKSFRHLPLIQAEDLWDVIPYDCIPVAVELVDGARSLVSYTHPERAFYLFGPEDGSIPREVLAKCRDVVYLPTTHCLNLAVTVGAVLYDRLAKQSYGVDVPYSRAAVRGAKETEREARFLAVAGGVSWTPAAAATRTEQVANRKPSEARVAAEEAQ